MITNVFPFVEQIVFSIPATFDNGADEGIAEKYIDDIDMINQSMSVLAKFCSSANP